MIQRKEFAAKLGETEQFREAELEKLESVLFARRANRKRPEI
jgi:hypothetical protein